MTQARVRPVTAAVTRFCPACGRQIVKGVHRVLKRFSNQDWVHARPSCLHSTLLYSQETGRLL